MNPLDNIMDVKEAAQRWGTTPAYVKKLCYLGKAEARTVGGAWILRKDQPNPMKQQKGTD